MRTLILTLMVIPLLSASAAEPELRGTAGELAKLLPGLPQPVVITGEAEVKVPADRALVTLRVRTDHRTLQEALRLNQEARGKLIAKLAEAGIGTNRIQTARFASVPRPGLFSDKARSYEIENQVQVVITNDTEFAAVARAIDTTSEAAYMETTFEHSAKAELKNKALTLACADAETRRKALEQALGVKLAVRRFAPDARLAAPGADLRRYADEASIYPARGVVQKSGVAAPVSESDGISAFGEVVVRAVVTVEYSLSQ